MKKLPDNSAVLDQENASPTKLFALEPFEKNGIKNEGCLSLIKTKTENGLIKYKHTVSYASGLSWSELESELDVDTTVLSNGISIEVQKSKTVIAQFAGSAYPVDEMLNPRLFAILEKTSIDKVKNHVSSILEIPYKSNPIESKKYYLLLLAGSINNLKIYQYDGELTPSYWDTANRNLDHMNFRLYRPKGKCVYTAPEDEYIVDLKNIENAELENNSIEDLNRRVNTGSHAIYLRSGKILLGNFSSSKFEQTIKLAGFEAVENVKSGILFSPSEGMIINYQENKKTLKIWSLDELQENRNTPLCFFENSADIELWGWVGKEIKIPELHNIQISADGKYLTGVLSSSNSKKSNRFVVIDLSSPNKKANLFETEKRALEDIPVEDRLIFDVLEYDGLIDDVFINNNKLYVASAQKCSKHDFPSFLIKQVEKLKIDNKVGFQRSSIFSKKRDSVGDDLEDENIRRPQTCNIM